MKLTCDWKQGLHFVARADEHSIEMDAKPSGGGQGLAPTPKQLVLAGICGCTGIDVVEILKKMRQPLESLSIDADASQTAGPPAVFDRVTLVYRAQGEGLKPEKVIEAVRFSQTKYCGVSAMIAKSAKIGYEVWVNGVSAGVGEAEF